MQAQEEIEAKKQEILGKIITNKEQRDTLQAEYDALDYEDRFKAASKYLGKYYKTKEEHHKDYHNVYFIYDISKESCTPQALHINYWGNQNTFYSIQHDHHFFPEQWEEEDKYFEITKDEFVKHYSEVFKLIDQSLVVKKSELPW